MPYSIRKVDGGFAVFNKATGQRKNSTAMTKAAAQKYMRALYANEPKKKTK